MPTPTVTPSLMMMGVNVAAAVVIPVVLVLLMVGVVVVGAVCGGCYYMHYHKQGSELILFINFLLYIYNVLFMPHFSIQDMLFHCKGK